MQFPRVGLIASIGVITALAGAPLARADEVPDDPYLWLEEIDGERAMAWVEAQNASTAARLKSNPDFEALYRDALAALDSKSRIPEVTQRGGFLYSFWRDEANPRGLYRRTTLAELRSAEPQWETVLDLDALSKAEGTQWVFKGMSCLPPEHRRCLISLSPGGGDAREIRELDAKSLSFVDDGFFLPTAKSTVGWVDEGSLYVGTDFGEGSLTDSGYPRISKRWRRGTPISSARTLIEVDPKSTSAGAFRIRTDDGDIDIVSERTSFWTGVRYHLVGDELHRLELPETASIEDGFRGRLVISLHEDWQRGESTFTQGSVLLAAPEVLHGGDGRIEVLVEPTGTSVVENVAATKQGILVTMLENVRGKLYRFEPADEGWTRREIPFPDNGALQVSSIDDETGSFFVEYESFVTPPTLYYVEGPAWKPEQIAAQEATFDGSKFEVRQLTTTSMDGTTIPYFVVMAKGMKLDGKNPTHIFSYGGFRASLTPSYSGSYEHLSGAYGKLWLERGGVFVLANIRGGGEFGPEWHSSVLKENHERIYEDFEAVAADLVARRFTSPEHLGIEGRSNGGLLVSSTFIRRPELYGAVVCGVPLADMKRYHKLLAGASWMAEYGDPDKPEEWAYIKKYSPYHNVKKGEKYPAVFFFTSTRDDRVHPGHARKLAARMIEQGYEVWYYENTEGGHGGSSTNEQLAFRLAQAYAHLWNQLR